MGIIPDPGIGAQVQHSWPSIVAEVGVSESLLHLRADAKWWWVNSDHQTTAIVLFYVNRSTPWSVTIETWMAQHVPVQGVETRQRSKEIAESCILHPSPPANLTANSLFHNQTITVTPTTVINEPLRIKFESIMHRPPCGNEKDILTEERRIV